MFAFFLQRVHTANEERMAPDLLFLSERASQLSITEIAKWPQLIRFVFSYVVPLITHRYKRRTVQEASLCNQSSYNWKYGQ